MGAPDGFADPLFGLLRLTLARFWQDEGHEAPFWLICFGRRG
ncbi:hypothetical protein [Nonomuraea phyllanthi]|nr:hypothetical protein [Nonomuraea phyllanthi]